MKASYHGQSWLVVACQKKMMSMSDLVCNHILKKNDISPLLWKCGAIFFTNHGGRSFSVKSSSTSQIHIYFQVLGSNSEATSSSATIALHCQAKRRHINKGFYIITRSDVDSVVSGIPPAEAGGWPSSIRLVSKIKPNDIKQYMMKDNQWQIVDKDTFYIFLSHSGQSR